MTWAASPTSAQPGPQTSEAKACISGHVARGLPSESAPASLFGLGTIVIASFTPALDAAGANTRIVVWNKATQKIQWFSALGTEVTAATDLSGYSAGFEIIGQ